MIYYRGKYLTFHVVGETTNESPKSYSPAALPTELRQPDPGFAVAVRVIEGDSPDHLPEGAQF